MISVALIIVALALAGSLGLHAWLIKTALSDRARTADTLFDLATANAEIERTSFELAATKQALQAATDRSAALERSLIDALSSSDATDLAPDDVRTRLLRIIEEQNARRSGGEVPAEPTGPVLTPSAEG